MIRFVLRFCAALFFASALLPVNIALAGSFGANLVSNGDAELGASASGTVISLPGWVTAGAVAELYGSSGFPSLSDPGPTDRGSRFFAGGQNYASSGPGYSTNATQDIDISFAASDIDTGKVSFNLSAWLGGYSSQDDNATVTASFFDAAGRPLGQAATIGPVMATDRGNRTGLLQRETSSVVPSQARTVRISILMTRMSGNYDDGYADNISLVLTKPALSRSDCLFNWAEQNYSQLFFPAATSATSSPYTYRYYSGTGNYLAVSSTDNNVFVLGPSFGNRLVVVGPVTSFLSVSGCP